MNGHNSAHDKKLKKLTLISQNLNGEENIVHLLFTIFSFSVNHVNKVLSLNLENTCTSASEPKLKRNKGSVPFVEPFGHERC